MDQIMKRIAMSEDVDNSGSAIHETYLYIKVNFVLLSPPVLMHGGLLCVAFRLSVCLSVTRK